MKITFVATYDEFSVYRDPRGEPVYVAHDEPFTRFTIDPSEVELSEEWEAFTNHGAYLSGWEQWKDGEANRATFQAFLRATLTEPNDANDLLWCVSCNLPGWRDGGACVEGTTDEWACDGCIDIHYGTCNRCDIITVERTWTLYDTGVCEYCCENFYSYCDHCEGYYSGDDDEHRHNQEGMDCCASPATKFTVRNDGLPALANDTKVTVTLPAGVIDEVGLNRIKQHLYGKSMYAEAAVIDQLGDAWQTKEGNFTKRFSRYLYKTAQLKVTPEVLSMIGTIAGEHSRSIDFEVMVTRELNQQAEDFYHEDSCWWSSHYVSRCALKTNGGFGLLTYDSYNVTGRAWVMPLKKGTASNGGQSLVPTFNTMEPDAFIVFNGYGALEGYTPARIVSHMAGLTYRKVNFGCNPMYVNSDMGYLVAPEDIAAGFTDGSLYLSTDHHSTLYHDEAAEALTTDLTDLEKELVNVA